jgi:uncharacterized protein (DUF2461 family)
MPEALVLKNMRQEVDYNWEEFRGILSEKKFKSIYGDLYQSDDVRLSTMPKGYEKDNPAAGYLRLKSFIAETRITDEELTKGSLHKKTVIAFEALQPLLNFINRTIETT